MIDLILQRLEPRERPRKGIEESVKGMLSPYV